MDASILNLLLEETPDPISSIPMDILAPVLKFKFQRTQRANYKTIGPQDHRTRLVVSGLVVPWSFGSLGPWILSHALIL